MTIADIEIEGSGDTWGSCWDALPTEDDLRLNAAMSKPALDAHPNGFGLIFPVGDVTSLAALAKSCCDRCCCYSYRYMFVHPGLSFPP